MSEVDRSDELRQLREDCERLRLELNSRNARIQALVDELQETNQGVVLLYAELEDKAGQLREVSDLKSRFLS